MRRLAHSRRPGRLAAAFGAALLVSSAPAFPDEAGGAAATAPLLPPVPTTRILAIGRLAPGLTPEAMRAVMPAEVRDTAKLYLDGKIDQWYIRKDQRGVVFVFNLTDTGEVHALLEALPLGRARLMDFDLIPLGPLAPLALLIGPPGP